MSTSHHPTRVTYELDGNTHTSSLLTAEQAARYIEALLERHNRLDHLDIAIATQAGIEEGEWEHVLYLWTDDGDIVATQVCHLASHAEAKAKALGLPIVERWSMK